MLQADREYICKLQKIRTIRKRMHTKYENAIFRINNKNRSIILNGWNLCALCFTERRWKRCKQQTDRKNIMQKEINAVSLNLNASRFLENEGKQHWKSILYIFIGVCLTVVFLFLWMEFTMHIERVVTFILYVGACVREFTH